MVTVLEAATRARITKQKVRYWLDLLEIETTRKEGKIYLPAAAVELLISMNNAVSAGLSPAVAAVEVKSVQALPVLNDLPIRNQDTAADKIAGLEKAVLLMASTLEKQGKLLEQQAAVISMQSAKLDNLTARLLPPPPSKPVQVWQPVEKKAPQVSWLKRAWLELINPVKLRATP